MVFLSFIAFNINKMISKNTLKSDYYKTRQFVYTAFKGQSNGRTFWIKKEIYKFTNVKTKFYKTEAIEREKCALKHVKNTYNNNNNNVYFQILFYMY